MIFEESKYDRPGRTKNILWDNLIEYKNDETLEVEVVNVQKELLKKEGLLMSEIYWPDTKDIETLTI